MNGVVSRIFISRGFGFLIDAELQSRMFNVADCPSTKEFYSMSEGTRVTFTPTNDGTSGNKLRAREVSVCPTSQESR